MSAFETDTFTEASDLTLASHVPNDGGSWTKHGSFSGTATVVAAEGRVRGDSTTNLAYYYHSGVPLSADYDVEAICRFSVADATGNPGVCSRIDTTTGTLYEWVMGAFSFLLRRLVAGAATQIGSYGVPVINTDYVLKLSTSGTTIKAYLDGVERISVTDSAISAAGKAGIRLRQNSRMDSYSVSDQRNTWYAFAQQ